MNVPISEGRLPARPRLRRTSASSLRRLPAEQFTIHDGKGYRQPISGGMPPCMVPSSRRKLSSEVIFPTTRLDWITLRAPLALHLCPRESTPTRPTLRCSQPLTARSPRGTTRRREAAALPHCTSRRPGTGGPSCSERWRGGTWWSSAGVRTAS